MRSNTLKLGVIIQIGKLFEFRNLRKNLENTVPTRVDTRELNYAKYERRQGIQEAPKVGRA